MEEKKQTIQRRNLALDHTEPLETMCEHTVTRDGDVISTDPTARKYPDSLGDGVIRPEELYLEGYDRT